MDVTAIAMKEVKLDPKVEEKVESKKALDYIKLVTLSKEINQKMIEVYEELSKEERKISNMVIMDTLSVPEFISVREAASIMDVTPQMVRRYCADNKLDAWQTMPGSGRWSIKTSQLVDYPGWKNFLYKSARIKQQSIEIAQFMNDELNNL